MSIVGSDDETPVGDTSQHAGEQTEEGTTVGGQDAAAHGGTGAPPTPPGDAAGGLTGRRAPRGGRRSRGRTVGKLTFWTALSAD